MNKSSLRYKLINAPYILWSVLFILAPMFMVVYYAFTNRDGEFTFENITALSAYGATFGRSIWYAFLATVICLLLAYPLAYIMGRSKASKQRTLMMLIMLPMWMNFLIRNFLPYMVLPIYSVMSKLEYSYVEAAQDLGCNAFSVLKRIIFPLSLPGVISGITMVFVPSVSTFYISQKLGGGKFLLVGDSIEMQFQSAYNYNLGASLSLVLMIMIIVCMLIMNRFADSEEGAILV